MHHKKLYGTATIGTKGQVVIPVEAREELNIQTGDKFYFIGSPKAGMLGMIKEDRLEELIDKMNIGLENLRKLKKEK